MSRLQDAGVGTNRTPSYDQSECDACLNLRDKPVIDIQFLEEWARYGRRRGVL